jgi:hypothetical protein
MREVERAPFKPLIPDSESVPVPVKKFDHALPAIAKNK